MTKNDQPLFSDADIENWKPKPSLVKTASEKGTISVSNKVDSNRIFLKVIAPYKQWIEWEEMYLSEGCINLAVIREFLTKRTPSSDIERVSEYEQACSYKFSSEFFTLYVMAANIENPQHHLWGIKERGGSPRTIEKTEKAEIYYNAVFGLMRFLRAFLSPQNLFNDLVFQTHC
jgi:hypothetical protein